LDTGERGYCSGFDKRAVKLMPVDDSPDTSYVVQVKLTIELPDALLEEVRTAARQRGISLQRLVELALRKELQAEAAAGAPIRLEDRSVGGLGLVPELRTASWEEIRLISYEDRVE
jgi:hypothetical protein